MQTQANCSGAHQQVSATHSTGCTDMAAVAALIGPPSRRSAAESALNRGLWTLVPTTTTPKASCPQQNNGCDCGLFTCMAADYIANNQLDLAYDQGAMPAFRRRMAARIIAGTLDAEEAWEPGRHPRSECL